MARKIKLKLETGKELTDTEKKALEAFKAYGINSESDLEGEAGNMLIKKFAMAAQNIGKTLYDHYFQTFTMKQSNNVGSNGYNMFPKQEKTENGGSNV